MKKRFRIEIKGKVQGVGFRPKIYRYAKARNLKGFVFNSSKGVLIEVEGEEEEIEEFLKNIKNSPPPLSEIKNISVWEIEIKNDREFRILKSKREGKIEIDIPPDIATCDECLNELFDEKNRRYLFPFINCVNCGPRFTIIKKLPYDRENTTMDKFIMCQDCKEEYENPESRRFHTQPNCCFKCGPKVFLLNREGRKIEESVDAIKETAKLIEKGEIVAVKGIGGFHLASVCDDERIVEKLRKRKKREHKPFALMARDIETIEKYCYMSEEEKKIIKSFKAPILLLEKKGNVLAENIAPDNRYLGFMLPYSPLHHLLFKFGNFDVLIMTSGNISENPIIYENEKALKELKDIADYFLIHERDIEIGCDDSVVKYSKFLKREIIIRKARGYIPSPLILPFNLKNKILGIGADLKNTFSFGFENKIYTSQHIGDLENYENMEFLERALNHFKNIFNFESQIICYDLHPDYFSSKYAQSLNGKKIGIQHHHAHISSCMIDNLLENRKIIGVAFDGTGYGTDGKIWGGEFLICDYENFERIAHLEYIPLIGGEMAIKEVWRMGAVYLFHTFGEDFLDIDIEFTSKIDRKKWKMFENMVKKKINVHYTSSMGRLFDAVSSICGIRNVISYEGQAAIELEMKIDENFDGFYKFEIYKSKKPYVVSVKKMIRGIVEDIKNGKDIGKISAKFHNTISKIIVEVCKIIRDEKGLNEVALSGGVFQNIHLLEKTCRDLQKEGFIYYTHKSIPPNDGGISVGQVIIGGFKCV